MTHLDRFNLVRIRINPAVYAPAQWRFLGTGSESRLPTED